jgi:DNA adenine methylase
MTTAERKAFLVSKYKVSPLYAEQILAAVSDDSFDDQTISKLLKQKPKPFVKWVGGKRQLISQFHELGALSPKGFDQNINTYFEPFVGGGAVFFELLPLKASINDINDELVTTYNVIRDDVDTLVSELRNGEYFYDKDVFLMIRAWDTTRISDIKRAARFIFLNRTAFNGMYRVNKSGQFNVPFGRYTNPQIVDEENLRNVSVALKQTKVSNGSYKHVLDDAKKGDFVYFDPPYYPVSKTASFTSYSNDVFLQREQEELRDAFVELHKRGCSVALSNSDTQFINDLFEPLQKKGITIHKVQAGRNINSKVEGRGKVFEVLVTNYV